MRLVLLGFLLSVAPIADAQGSNCDEVLTSQADVDAFDCTSISSLLISGDAQNLDGLAELTTIGGDLRIVNNTALADLDGLGSLVSIGGDFFLGANTDLVSVDSLSSLAAVVGRVAIYDNPMLPDVDGFASLTSVGGSSVEPGLYIQGNAMLARCTVGFSDLVSAYQADPGVLPGGTYTMGNGADLIGRYAQSDCNEAATIISPGEGPNCDLALTSQAEVEAFDCTRINGTLTIQGIGITDLSSLAVLESAAHLSILVTSLVDLTGLESFETNGRTFIGHNDALQSLDGLESLTRVSQLELFELTALSSLDALSSLTTIDAKLSIQGVRQLVDLSGLESLERIGGDVLLFRNDRLSTLSHLESLREIGGELKLGNNPALDNLLGLEQVEEVEHLYVRANRGLTSLDGLNGLERVRDYIYIRDNDELRNVDALANLTFIGGGDAFGTDTGIGLLENRLLERCAVGLGPILTANAADPSVIGEPNIIGPNGEAVEPPATTDCTSEASILAAYAAAPPSALPLADASLTPSDAEELLLPPGRGTSRLQAEATFTGDTGQRFTVFVRLDGPDGYSRVAFRGEVKPRAGQTISQSIRLRTTQRDPAGAYTVSLMAEEGSVVAPSESAETVATLPATKAGAGLRSDEPLSVFPNPATDAATLRFAVAETTDATLVIYDALGREVARPIDGPAEGATVARFDASALPAGVYVARLTTGVRTETARFTVVR